MTDKELLDDYCSGWGLTEEGKKAMEDTFAFKYYLLGVRFRELVHALLKPLEPIVKWLTK